MAQFDYVALDVSGRERQGVLSAADEAAALKLLHQRRLAPVRVAASVARSKRQQRGLFGPRLSLKALTLATRQLATLTAVAPLEEALRTIAYQAESATVRRVMLDVHAGLLEGFRLSDAMGRRPESFPALYRAMIAAGEASGALPAILERLADLAEREQDVRGKVMAALLYPALLCLTAVGVVVVLMTFVVPKLVEQFADLNQRLPLLTRIVIGVSDAMRIGGLPALAVLGGLGFLLVTARRRPQFREAMDAGMLRAPLLGRVLRDLHSARLARTLATMTTSGLPLLEGLSISARTLNNAALKRAVTEMATSIREGGSLSAAMRRANLFPQILIYMTASGENSGRLEPMLERAAEYLEREFAAFSSTVLVLLEPIIILVMGFVVAVIVLSILLPILQINTLALG